MSWFERVVSALAYSLAEEAAAPDDPRLSAPYDDVARFLARSLGEMPDHLRGPVRLLTLAFDAAGLIHGGALFHRQQQVRRSRQIAAWRGSVLGPCRDLVRLYQNLALFALYCRLDPHEGA